MVRWQKQVFIHTWLSRAYLAFARLSCFAKANLFPTLHVGHWSFDILWCHWHVVLPCSPMCGENLVPDIRWIHWFVDLLCTANCRCLPVLLLKKWKGCDMRIRSRKHTYSMWWRQF